MPYEVGDVLDEEQTWFEKRNIVRHGRQDAVVSLSAVVMAVAELAESFTWWACGEQIDLAEPAAVGLHEIPAVDPKNWTVC
jgi:hypothetical protein